MRRERLYLRWYFSAQGLGRHPHSGREYGDHVWQPGTTVLVERYDPDAEFLDVYLPGKSYAMRLPKTDLIDHWPPREDE